MFSIVTKAKTNGQIKNMRNKYLSWEQSLYLILAINSIDVSIVSLNNIKNKAILLEYLQTKKANGNNDKLQKTISNPNKLDIKIPDFLILPDHLKDLNKKLLNELGPSVKIVNEFPEIVLTEFPFLIKLFNRNISSPDEIWKLEENG